MPGAIGVTEILQSHMSNTNVTAHSTHSPIQGCTNAGRTNILLKPRMKSTLQGSRTGRGIWLIFSFFCGRRSVKFNAAWGGFGGPFQTCYHKSSSAFQSDRLTPKNRSNVHHVQQHENATATDEWRTRLLTLDENQVRWRSVQRNGERRRRHCPVCNKCQ